MHLSTMIARSKRQDQILDVVTPLFAARGFHKVGMAEICEECGMSPGSFYRYFDSKAHLIRCVVWDQEKALLEIWKRVCWAGDVREAITSALVRSMLRQGLRERALLRLEILAEAVRNQEIGEFMREMERQSIERVKEVIDGAKSNGEIDEKVDTRSVAVMVVKLSTTAAGTSAVGLPLPMAGMERLFRPAVDALLPAPAQRIEPPPRPSSAPGLLRPSTARP